MCWTRWQLEKRQRSGAGALPGEKQVWKDEEETLEMEPAVLPLSGQLCSNRDLFSAFLPLPLTLAMLLFMLQKTLKQSSRDL